MDSKITYRLIETIVRKKLNEIQDSPERSVRNLVDMALQFSVGRFQQHFFEMAQLILQNADSAYYPMISEAISRLDIERIIKFGMNLGYNSCTKGAKIIRSIEEKEKFNIPWTIFIEIDGSDYQNKKSVYHSIIEQGEELGIYTWVIFVRNKVEPVFELVREYTDSAFVVFCTPEMIEESMLSELETVNNIMIAVKYMDSMEEACMKLRDRGFLYSIYFSYEDKDISKIVDGEILRNTERMHPTFTAFLPEKESSEGMRKKVFEYVLETRMQQTYQTIPWDMLNDMLYVDSIISEDSCVVGFKENGQMYHFLEKGYKNGINIFEQSLCEILKEAFPKDAMV